METVRHRHIEKANTVSKKMSTKAKKMSTVEPAKRPPELRGHLSTQPLVQVPNIDLHTFRPLFKGHLYKQATIFGP